MVYMVTGLVPFLEGMSVLGTGWELFLVDMYSLVPVSDRVTGLARDLEDMDC
jgi:hypothetical protein